MVALRRTPEKARALEALGAQAAVADAFDKHRLTAVIKQVEPEVIIHQLTSLSGVANFKKMDEDFAVTNRLRTEVTDTLLTAAHQVGARHFIAQSLCGWPFEREGGPIKTEADGSRSTQVGDVVSLKEEPDRLKRILYAARAEPKSR